MHRNFILIGGIAAFVAIAALCVRQSLRTIPLDISDRTVKQLSEADMKWARVMVKGRDVRLSGLAPDAQARQQAAQLAAGVRSVDNRVLTIGERVASQTPAKPAAAAEPAGAGAARPANLSALDELFADLPYGMRMNRQGQRIEIEGTVPSEAMITTVTTLAEQRFGEGAATVALQVRPGAPENWLQAASAAMALLEDVDPGAVNISNNEVTVSGVTPSPAAVERLRMQVGNSLPPSYVGRSEVSLGSGLQDLVRTNPGLARRIGDTGGPQNAPPQPVARPPDTRPSPGVGAQEMLTAAQCQRAINSLSVSEVIQFETASDVLNEPSYPLLDQVAAIAARCPRARLEIGGHTDDQGLESNNLALSQRRAESVMAYLVSRGMRLNRLSARGYGESQPLVPNETAAARAINRRIEFNVTGDY